MRKWLSWGHQKIWGKTQIKHLVSPAHHRSTLSAVCRVTSLSFIAVAPLWIPLQKFQPCWSMSGCYLDIPIKCIGIYLDIPIKYIGIYLDTSLISLVGGTLISKTLRYTELISGSVQGGDCTYNNLSWLDLFSCRTCALLTSLWLQPQFSGALPLRGSVGVVWSGLCFLFNGLFIFLNFNDLTPIWRLPLPLLSLSSRTCFSPGQLPSSR